MSQKQELCFYVEAEDSGKRIDKLLAERAEDLSRSRIQSLIDQGCAYLNGAVLSAASKKVEEGDEIKITVPVAIPAMPKAQPITLDIVYEDNDLLVLNKQAGLVVHPGAGNPDSTLVNALLAHCGDTLSGIGGVMRPGIVHRLDKDTSGLMVVAKNDMAHQGLSDQLADRSLSREYVALVCGVPSPFKDVIDQPIGRHRTNRIKMAVTSRPDAREARTFYQVEQQYGGALSVVGCKLESGRTHQIRVHMLWLGHPLVGDPLYSPQPTKIKSLMAREGFDEAATKAVLHFPRQALHARAISFIHPGSGEEMFFTAELPDDFSNLLKKLDKSN